MVIYGNKNKIISIKRMQEIINYMQWVINMFDDEIKQAYVYNEHQWYNKINKMKKKGHSRQRIKYVKQCRKNRINCKVLNSWKSELDSAVNMFIQLPLIQLVNSNTFQIIDFTKSEYKVVPSSIQYDDIG